MYCFSLVLFLFAVIPSSSATAQQVETCEERGTASAYLDVNNVRAALYNNGNLFYGPDRNIYEVPKESSKHSIFTSSVWIGGYIKDSLRVNASTYGRFFYRPGPLADDGSPPENCTPFDHLWKVSQSDITHYEATGEATDDLRNWPAELGAPVVDGDGNLDNYDLAAGDRPAIRGDQGIWWIMNDVAAPRHELQSSPIGLEVRVLAYAFDDTRVLSNTTFYDYTFTYKGEGPLTNAYVGPWADIEIGNYLDDRVGTDTTLHMVYGYNSDNDDTPFVPGIYGYGNRPPALGYVLLGSPIGDDGQPLGMTTSLALYDNFTYRGQPFLTYPDPATHAYNFLRGHSETGLPVTFGGSGIGFSEEPTTYMFPAEPGEFWSEENIDGNSPMIFNDDRRMLLSSGPFTMQPGDTQHLRFAIVWAQAPEGSTNPRLDAVKLLKRDVRSLLPTSTAVDATAEVPATFQLHGNYPNPFNPTTRIAFDLPEAARVSLSVYDVLGREVMVLPARQMASGAGQTLEIHAESFPSGMYLYRVMADGTS